MLEGAAMGMRGIEAFPARKPHKSSIRLPR
jgi:hypothetical protein